MSGWWWAVGGAAWILLSPLVALAGGRAVRHGEQQPRAGRAARQSRPHATSWGTEHPNPSRPRTARQTPAWARTDHHNGRHRR